MDEKEELEKFKKRAIRDIRKLIDYQCIWCRVKGFECKSCFVHNIEKRYVKEEKCLKNSKKSK